MSMAPEVVIGLPQSLATPVVGTGRRREDHIASRVDRDRWHSRWRLRRGAKCAAPGVVGAHHAAPCTVKFEFFVGLMLLPGREKVPGQALPDPRPRRTQLIFKHFHTLAGAETLL